MENKVVWITGASSGIGKALAIEWSQYSVCLILSGRNIDALKKVAGRCKERGSSCLILDFDLNDIESYPKWVDTALDGRVQLITW